MNVAAILKEKGSDVVTLKPHALVSEVAGILYKKRIGAIVVLDKAGVLSGIVSERDIVNAIAKNGRDVIDKPVQSIMTGNVISCRKSDPIDRLMEIMTETRVRHLPVVEDGKLCGIVSIGDVVKYRIAEVSQEMGALRDYISSG